MCKSVNFTAHRSTLVATRECLSESGSHPFAGLLHPAGGVKEASLRPASGAEAGRREALANALARDRRRTKDARDRRSRSNTRLELGSFVFIATSIGFDVY